MQTGRKQCRICLLHVFLVCSGNKAQPGGTVFSQKHILPGAARSTWGRKPVPRAGEQPFSLSRTHQCPRSGLAFSRLTLALSWLHPWVCCPHACFYGGDVTESLTLGTTAHGDSCFSTFKPLEPSPGMPLSKEAPSRSYCCVVRLTPRFGMTSNGLTQRPAGWEEVGQLDLPGDHLHQLLVATGSRSVLCAPPSSAPSALLTHTI